MIYPTINVNGTAAERLVEQYCMASDALAVAIQRVQSTEPHGRDYAGQPATYQAAMEDHARRLKALEGVREEFRLLAEYADGCCS